MAPETPVRPQFALPLPPLIRLALLTPVATALAVSGAGFLAGLDRQVSVGLALGATAGLVGALCGLWALKPKKPTDVTRWPARLLTAQLATFAGVLVSGLLLYSAARPGPVWFALSAAGVCTWSLIAQAKVFAAAFEQSKQNA